MASAEGDYDCSFLDEVIEQGRVAYTESQREQYQQDASPKAPSLPDAVVWPETADETARILQAASERRIPVTPWSGGSGLEGNAIPVDGGIVLSTFEMTTLDIHQDDLQVTVGAGVVYDELNDALGRHGLRFPPGISSGDVATIGGMIATNASGFNAVRYGETRDHVRHVEAVLPDGRIVQCGRGVVKTSSGYSLKDLLIGSEGTLGVVTEATLGLAGIPKEKRAALVTFPTATAACTAVWEIIRYGLDPGALEYVGEAAIPPINAYSDIALPVEPTLIIELHGNNAGIDEDLAFVRTICEDNDASTWEAADGDAIDDIWQARRDAYPAIRTYRDEWDIALVGDIVVPISKYPEIVARLGDLAAEYELTCTEVGHAGDGNLHYTPLVDPADDAMVERAWALNEEMVEAALDLGGTATGEHGIGIGKRQFLEREHGSAAVSLMRELKETIDPNGIMNPGKVLPAD